MGCRRSASAAADSLSEAGEGIPLDIENLRKRAEALRTIDAGKVLKRSYENPDVIAYTKTISANPEREVARDSPHHYKQRFPSRLEPDVMRRIEKRTGRHGSHLCSDLGVSGKLLQQDTAAAVREV